MKVLSERARRRRRNKSDFLVCQRWRNLWQRRGRGGGTKWLLLETSFRSYRECFILLAHNTQWHNLQNVTLYAKNKMIKYECEWVSEREREKKMNPKTCWKLSRSSNVTLWWNKNKKKTWKRHEYKFIFFYKNKKLAVKRTRLTKKNKTNRECSKSHQRARAHKRKHKHTIYLTKQTKQQWKAGQKKEKHNSRCNYTSHLLQS